MLDDLRTSGRRAKSACLRCGALGTISWQRRPWGLGQKTALSPCQMQSRRPPKQKTTPPQGGRGFDFVELSEGVIPAGPQP
ncbi:hypothetical protein RV134_360074 [Roseovarius sp. EC-HK134]|nr:hypothetical protein RV134_360074 [Roseovarius sp. EC-HK134]VVT32773.1 hypothetical protein RV420_450081 [Roseovarius sp. EC-SD190]